MQSFIITKDLPDIFDIEIIHINTFDDKIIIAAHRLYSDQQAWLWRLFNFGTSIYLTIDVSESRADTFIVKPDLPAIIRQTSAVSMWWSMAGSSESDKIEHKINIDTIKSKSPLGNTNLLVFTQTAVDIRHLIPRRTSGSPEGEVVGNFYIVDDKGNFYPKSSTQINSNIRWYHDFEPESVAVEFHGDILSDAEYLKLIPYDIKSSGFININATASSLLPQKFTYSEYGSIIVESVTATHDEITIIYKTEGLACTAGNNNLFYVRRPGGVVYSWGSPVYNPDTDAYTFVITFSDNHTGAQNYVGNIEMQQFDVELLEDQAVIIPLR